MDGRDSVIVAVIMIGMLVAGAIGCIIAIRKRNSGFISSVKYKENAKEKERKDSSKR